MIAGTALEYGDKMLACLDETEQQNQNFPSLYFEINQSFCRLQLFVRSATQHARKDSKFPLSL